MECRVRARLRVYRTDEAVDHSHHAVLLRGDVGTDLVGVRVRVRARVSVRGVRVRMRVRGRGLG